MDPAPPRSTGTGRAVSGSDKTEKATPQRRRKARQEGTVARSQEIGVVLSLGGMVLAVRVLAPPAMDVLRRETERFLSLAPTERVALGVIGWGALKMVLAMAGPILVVGVLAALATGVQTQFRWATKAAQPKLSHLSPKRGLQRLKPATSIWELARSAAKLGLLFLVVWGPLREWTDVPPTARSLDSGVGITIQQAWTLLLRGLMVAGLVAAVDYLYQFRKTNKQIKMTKEEIKQEFKNSEGDPHIKGQRKRRHQELSRSRMMAEVMGADVVVTNPTHLAVALKFRDGEAAPRVVAKGADHLAAKIRSEAYRNGVPVRHDVPLARALYRQCKVGAYVPGALYEAVAIVLAFAYRVSGKVSA